MNSYCTKVGLRTFGNRIIIRKATDMNNMICRWKASSALPDLPIPELIRDSVKQSVLDDAVRDDSRLWKKELNTSNNDNNNSSDSASAVNQSTLPTGCDPLNDLYIDEPTRYWPGLPEQVQYSADPFALANKELSRMAESIRNDLIGTDHPVLNQAASYFFDAAISDGGKKVRPMMVLLLSRALSDDYDSASSSSSSSTTNTRMRNNNTKINGDGTSTDYKLFSQPMSWQRDDLPALQRRLAEISEMIHTASLLHDDVIDGADTRRGVPAVHSVFGNKMAILAGDYLLARASICLARLRNIQVVETMSLIIEHLVRGEVMQLRGTTTRERSTERLVYYLRKNFYKTGSLMANSCKSAALLGGYPAELVDASYRYGKHVGMAFQLVDDVLDFEGNIAQLGKPALADLNAGLATAPVLFAAEEYPELEPLIDRKFKQNGDVDQAVDLVFSSHGIERTKELARVHAEYAMDAILQLNSSEHRDSLVNLANKVVARTK